MQPSPYGTRALFCLALLPGLILTRPVPCFAYKQEDKVSLAPTNDDAQTLVRAAFNGDLTTVQQLLINNPVNINVARDIRESDLCATR
jgi:hypothetical protein